MPASLIARDSMCLAAGVCTLAIAASQATACEGAQSLHSDQAQTTQSRSGQTVAQTKLDTRLRTAIERLRAKDTDAADARMRSGALDLDESGRALVDIDARFSAELKSAIEAAGGLVVSEFPQFKSVRARVPLSKIESLAERLDVQFIRPAEQAMTNPSESAR